MKKSNLSQKISSNSVCWPYQNAEKGITSRNLYKLNQEQGFCSSINEEEHFKHQPERKQKQKSNPFTENQRLGFQYQGFELKKQQLVGRESSIGRKQVQGEFILGETQNLKYREKQQKDFASATMQNLSSTSLERSNTSISNLNTFQDNCVSKASSNNWNFYQQKQQNQPQFYENSFSSLGTISEESSQMSQSSQNLVFSERKFANSQLQLDEKEVETDQDQIDEKDRKKSDLMILLIPCLVILALSYLYLVIVQ